LTGTAISGALALAALLAAAEPASRTIVILGRKLEVHKIPAASGEDPTSRAMNLDAVGARQALAAGAASEPALKEALERNLKRAPGETGALVSGQLKGARGARIGLYDGDTLNAAFKVGPAALLAAVDVPVNGKFSFAGVRPGKYFLAVLVPRVLGHCPLEDKGDPPPCLSFAEGSPGLFKILPKQKKLALPPIDFHIVQ
jgi:hypothetical protein